MRQRGAEEVERNSVVIIVARQDLLKTSGYSRCPDFIFQREEPDGSLKYVIVEVKADNQIEDAVVQAKKDFAQQIAVASGMEYRILKSSDADKRQFRVLL